jgi:hypothetical protein
LLALDRGRTNSADAAFHNTPQKVDTHPASRVSELTPWVWAEKRKAGDTP